MTTWELFIIAVGLSMDAFAVSICKGLSVRKAQLKHLLICGAFFGGFQALMPTIGYFLGRQFESFITSVDHWITFILLVIIGINMIREAFGDEEEQNSSFSFKTMLPLALATSIDALVSGVSLNFSDTKLLIPTLIIGFASFGMSLMGFWIGNFFKKFPSKYLEIFGGIILCVLAVKAVF